MLKYAQTDFGSMYLDDELDASIGLVMVPGSGIDRQRKDLSGHEGFTTLFSDPRVEATRFMKKHGVYPPHHVTVIRESIVREHPWVAVSLMEGFRKSKELAIQRLHEKQPSLMVFGGQVLKEVTDVFTRDPFPYGINANAKAFDMAQTFSVEQGLSKKKQPWDEIFPEEVMYAEEKL